MIDLHAHCLPGIDDGPGSPEEALELCRAAALDGITVMAATPHVRPDHPAVHPGELAARCEELNRLLRREHMSLQVVPGGEVDLLWAQSASDEELRLVSLCQGGACLLVETPYGALAGDFEDLLFRIQVRGYRVLLAHPERSTTLRDDPERLVGLVRRGVFTQITAPALRERGRRAPARRFALWMARERLAHVVSSDAHRASGPRPVGLSDAVKALDGVRPGLGRMMAYHAPAALLANTSVPVAPASRGRFFGRRSTRG